MREKLIEILTENWNWNIDYNLHEPGEIMEHIEQTADKIIFLLIETLNK